VTVARLYFFVVATLVCGLSPLTATPAHADDWEFAEFGMTVDQVAVASGGRAVTCMGKMAEWCRSHSPGYAWTALWMKLKVDGYDVIALFNFDDKTGRFAEVSLTLSNPLDNQRWFEETRDKLQRLYGPEKRDSIASTPAWKWKWEKGEIWMYDPPRASLGAASMRYVSLAGIAAMGLKPFDPN